jgi:hypothetical protein
VFYLIFVVLSTKTVTIAQEKYCLVRIYGSQGGSYYKGKSSSRFGYQMGQSCNGEPEGYMLGVEIEIIPVAFHLGASRGARTFDNANQKIP